MPVTKSCGFICHEPVFSRLTIPCCAVSIRDGYAVISADTHPASESNPVELFHTSWVHTGSPIPEGYDAVIMQEDIRIGDHGKISIIKPARPGQFIQKEGSEIRTGTMILPAGHLITPEDVGAMIGCGIITIQVRILTAGLIPTGDELKEPCSAPGPGEVISSNCQMMGASLEKLGITPVIYPIVPDNPDRIQDAIFQAVGECSFVIVTGGSSTGKRDHTSTVLSTMGTIQFHGIAMRPGKTTLAAVVDDIPVFGLPGTPAGAYAVLRELIIPWLADTGFPVPVTNSIDAVVAESIPSDLGTDDFVQVVVGGVRDRYRAVLVPRTGGQRSSVQSNGIIHIPRNSEGFQQNKECLVKLTRHYPHPSRILLFSGVHDPLLDYLDQFLRTMGMAFFCRQASLESTLLTINNGNYHGRVIKRPCINGRFIPQDYSLLTGPVQIVTVAEKEYILASRTFSESGTPIGVICPALPEKSFLRLAMDEYLNLYRTGEGDIYRCEPLCNSDQEVIQKIQTGQVDFGPCSGYLGSSYDLEGPVIGAESIDLLFRKDESNAEQVTEIIRILASAEWKEAISSIPGYDSEKSGLTGMLE